MKQPAFSVVVGVVLVVVVAADGFDSSRDMCSGSQLVVSYNSITPTCDQVVPKSETQSQPTVMYKAAEEGATYVLFMVDPDVPKPYQPYWFHWARWGISGTSLQGGSLDGSDIKGYAGPSPPSVTHRYQFFLFKDNGGKYASVGARGNFDLEDYLKKAELGEPVATFEFKVAA